MIDPKELSTLIDLWQEEHLLADINHRNWEEPNFNQIRAKISCVRCKDIAHIRKMIVFCSLPRHRADRVQRAGDLVRAFND